MPKALQGSSKSSGAISSPENPFDAVGSNPKGPWTRQLIWRSTQTTGSCCCHLSPSNIEWNANTFFFVSLILQARAYPCVHYARYTMTILCVVSKDIVATLVSSRPCGTTEEPSWELSPLSISSPEITHTKDFRWHMTHFLQRRLRLGYASSWVWYMKSKSIQILLP